MQHPQEHVYFQLEKTLRQCPKCDLKFNDLELMDSHLATEHPLPSPPQQGQGPADEDPCNITRALDGDVNRYKYPARFHETDIHAYFDRMRPQLQRRIEEQLAIHHAIRWYFVIQIRFVRPPGEFTYPSPGFYGGCHTTLISGNTDADFNSSITRILDEMDEFNERGSGWTIVRIEGVELNILRYQPLGASKYLPLPNALQGKRSLINVVNRDHRCFLWAYLALKHHGDVLDAEQPLSYHEWTHELKMEGLEYPSPST